MGGVLKAEHIAGEFQHDVLQAAAGGQERQVVLAGMADRRKRTGQALIRAAGSDPEGGEITKRFSGSTLQRRCRQASGFDSDADTASAAWAMAAVVAGCGANCGLKSPMMATRSGLVVNWCIATLIRVSNC